MIVHGEKVISETPVVRLLVRYLPWNSTVVSFGKPQREMAGRK